MENIRVDGEHRGRKLEKTSLGFGIRGEYKIRF